MILDINPSIIYPMIERMLGGGREPSMTARRPLTNIEWKLIQRIIDAFLEELKKTWSDIIDLEYSITQQESNPQFICAIKNNEPVVVLCFEVALIELRGSVSLCIPVDVLNMML